MKKVLLYLYFLYSLKKQVLQSFSDNVSFLLLIFFYPLVSKALDSVNIYYFNLSN